MNNVMSFVFERNTIRVVLDTSGIPWFNASDVCGVLGYTNSTRIILTHLDEDDAVKFNAMDKIGRLQSMNYINEAGLHSLIAHSKKQNAKRFTHWIDSTVLPLFNRSASILPDSVGAPQMQIDSQVNALLLIGQSVSKLQGVREDIAMATTLDAISKSTGLEVENLRAILPNNQSSSTYINPTELGRQVSLNARSINLRLMEKGFQRRNKRGEWELSVSGRQYGQVLPYSRNGHNGYWILWSIDVLKVINVKAA